MVFVAEMMDEIDAESRNFAWERGEAVVNRKICEIPVNDQNYAPT